MENKKRVAARSLAGLKRYRYIVLLVLFCVFYAVVNGDAGEHPAAVFFGKGNEKETVVVLDAGHGGVDPGKVGSAGSLEKEINLAVALELKSLLEADGIRVVMTRETDTGLYSENTENKKREDMEERVRVIAEAAPVLAVSIHQNSYPTAECKGAQVFYYKDSVTGKSLAETMQQAFLNVLADGNKRQAKANGDYYLLRKAPCTMVIAECGFLSNPAEETLLVTAEYQKKVAEALHQGILAYLEKMVLS